MRRRVLLLLFCFAAYPAGAADRYPLVLVRQGGVFDGFADATFSAAGGTFAAALGLVGVGIAA